MLEVVTSPDFILLVARFVLGVVMIHFGWPKIKNLRDNARDFNRMGFKPGMFWGSIIAIVEFFGGIALIAGFYVWIASALIAVQMVIGTLWKITKTEKPFSNWSYDLLILVITLVLIYIGPGKYVIYSP